MRIRKNAKISTLIYTTPNAGDESLLQKNLCQLNQSPWDIITFPPSDSSSSFYQFDDNEVYYNVNLAGNGSSFDSVGDFESVASVRTFKGENYDFDAPKNGYEEILRFEDGEMSGIREETVLCGKRDKEGWQCGRVMKDGDMVCDRHTLTDLQNDEVWTTKKKCGPVHESRATRARQKTKKRGSTSPYEFYYYSGFGPSWGKKRGSTGTTSIVCNEASQASKVKEMSPNDYDMDLREESMLEPKMDHIKMELDHIEEDDDDTKNGKKVIVGKKRGRKPIKARSLKSLM